MTVIEITGFSDTKAPYLTLWDMTHPSSEATYSGLSGAMNVTLRVTPLAEAHAIASAYVISVSFVTKAGISSWI